MKAKRVVYSRLISKGNYENAKIEIEVEIEDGETAKDAFEAAKQFVNNRIDVEKMATYVVERARLVLADKRNHTIAQIEEAEEVMKKLEIDENLPF